MKRRKFLNAAMMTGIRGLTLPAAAALRSNEQRLESYVGSGTGSGNQTGAGAGPAPGFVPEHNGNPADRITPRICLNAFSFNARLRSGEVTLEEMFRFAAVTGFAGIDLTAYYIPEYPEVPDDKVLFDIKKMAFRYGIGITGTGVRNDFALPDADARSREVQLVKNWIIAASKMGAPHVRVFAGKSSPEGYTREEVKSWIIEGFRECAAFGEKHGVMVAFQNHDDYIVYTPDIIDIMEAVPSDWFGLMLDIGSLPVADPYREIEKLIPYAITWQLKENVKTDGAPKPTDFARLMKIIDQSGYEGYLPLETLGEGDPFEKVKRLYSQVKALM
jgi:sugar phosphate isomerase/epimerase